MTTQRTTDAGEDPHAPYIEAWKRRIAAREAADRKFAGEAMEVAREAAGRLVEGFGVERVILFGSLAGWRRFRRDSDIDLAVDGLAPQPFIRADADLAWHLSAPIDLKLLDDCPSLLRQRIEEEGVVLHGG